MDMSSVTIECPVCATRIEGTADVCGRCQTPHHQDCARFIGRCAVFGCGAFEFGARSVEASVQAAEATIDGASGTFEAINAAPAALRRDIWERMKASARLLYANPELSAPLMAVLVVLNCFLAGLLAGPAKLVVLPLLTILFVARAKGKESTFTHALSLLMQRGLRIVWNVFKANLVFGLLLALGGMISALGISVSTGGGASAGLGLILALLGVLVLFAAVRKYFSYSLVPVIASLGAEEEPGSPLDRSEALFNVAPKQLLYAPFVFGLASIPAIFVAGIAGALFGSSSKGSFLFTMDPAAWVGIALIEAVWLCWSMYLVLYYLEARKVLQASSLPFTPEGF